MKIDLTNYQITILRPGGNDTALIKGLIKNNALKKAINDEVMRIYPTVEQVGFYEFDEKENLAMLEMAGGEFCGNATRSLAYLLLGGGKGQLNIRVSGSKQKLIGGSRKKGTAYATMPIFPNLSAVKKINDTTFRVELEGIIHLLILSEATEDKEVLIARAKKLLKQNNLLIPYPAAGVMFVKQISRVVSLKPVVWVRDIETLFYETACASGTTALGLWSATQGEKDRTYLKALQPSKQFIGVTIKKNTKQFLEATIDGPIQIIKENL